MLCIAGILVLTRVQTDFGGMPSKISGVQAYLLGIVFLVGGLMGIFSLSKRK